MSQKKKADKVEPKRQIRGKVIQRVKAGKCLVGVIPYGDTPSPLCDCESGTRGLCGTHYNQFWRTVDSFDDPAEAAAWADEQVREGQILPFGWARTLTSNAHFKSVG